MDIGQTIKDYENLREACYIAARQNDGALMRSDAWLRFAISPNDIDLSFGGGDFVHCYGYTFTSQTMSTEPFDFNIPLSALNL